MTNLKAYRDGIADSLEQCRSDLEPLENGEMKIHSARGGEEWRDITGEMIAHHRRTIATYEMILRDVDQRIADAGGI